MLKSLSIGSLSLLSMLLPQTDVFGSLPDSPGFIIPLSRREKWDLWVNLHRARYTISNDVMHPSSCWHHVFLPVSHAVTTRRLMDALMSFSSHLFWIHDALHMQKLFEIWYDNLKWSSHDNSLKGTYYALFTRCKLVLGVPRMCLWSSAQNTQQIIYFNSWKMFGRV